MFPAELIFPVVMAMPSSNGKLEFPRSKYPKLLNPFKLPFTLEDMFEISTQF